MKDEKQVSIFEKKITDNVKIEPKDWMPEAYRQALIQQIAQDANSKMISILVDKAWLTRVPSLSRKATLLSKIQDEAGHGLYLYCVAETLGVSRNDLIKLLLTNKTKYLSAYNYPILGWADVGMLGWLVGTATIIMHTSLQDSSYGPYARTMLPICMEETFHQEQSYNILLALANGNAEQKAMAQDSINRWWWRVLMMFGEPDELSKRNDILIKWRIKIHTNDELRQRFIDMVIAKIDKLSLTIPDKYLKFNPNTMIYDHGSIDLEEFSAVVNSNEIFNSSRLAVMKETKKSNLWVSEAMLTYSNKQKNRR